jgi:hypothetical protein
LSTEELEISGLRFQKGTFDSKRLGQENPLSLTLSPSDGEREKLRRRRSTLLKQGVNERGFVFHRGG